MMDGHHDADFALSFDRRLALLRDSGQASRDVIDFVHREMTALAGELGISLESDGAGMLGNHLVLALQRAVSGEPYDGGAQLQGLLESELEAHPQARHCADQVADHARTTLNADLPQGERNYVAIHLAALLVARDEVA